MINDNHLTSAWAGKDPYNTDMHYEYPEPLVEYEDNKSKDNPKYYAPFQGW